MSCFHVLVASETLIQLHVAGRFKPVSSAVVTVAGRTKGALPGGTGSKGGQLTSMGKPLPNLPSVSLFTSPKSCSFFPITVCPHIGAAGAGTGATGGVAGLHACCIGRALPNLPKEILLTAVAIKSILFVTIEPQSGVTETAGFSMDTTKLGPLPYILSAMLSCATTNDCTIAENNRKETHLSLRMPMAAVVGQQLAN